MCLVKAKKRKIGIKKSMMGIKWRRKDFKKREERMEENLAGKRRKKNRRKEREEMQ